VDQISGFFLEKIIEITYNLKRIDQIYAFALLNENKSNQIMVEPFY